MSFQPMGLCGIVISSHGFLWDCPFNTCFFVGPSHPPIGASTKSRNSRLARACCWSSAAYAASVSKPLASTRSVSQRSLPCLVLLCICFEAGGEGLLLVYWFFGLGGGGASLSIVNNMYVCLWDLLGSFSKEPPAKWPTLEWGRFRSCPGPGFLCWFLVISSWCSVSGTRGRSFGLVRGGKLTVGCLLACLPFGALCQGMLGL